jgi:hypothetical protein
MQLNSFLPNYPELVFWQSTYDVIELNKMIEPLFFYDHIHIWTALLTLPRCG